MNIKFSTRNTELGEAVQGVFFKAGEWFYADLCNLPYYGNECMIFRANKDGKVTDWGELYSNYPDCISKKALEMCIEEFCSSDYFNNQH